MYLNLGSLWKKTRIFQEIALNYMKECRNHSEFITNRKLWFFWFETVLQFFFSTPKNIFLRSIEKNKNWKMMFFDFFLEIEKSENLQWKSYMIFIENFHFFRFPKKIKKHHFSNFIFFNRSQKNIFRSWKKSWSTVSNQKNHSFRLVINSEWFLHSFMWVRAISWNIRVFFHKLPKLSNVLRITTLNTPP